MQKKRFLIDTDPGVDDALALLMVFSQPRCEVVALTVGAGNVGIAHTVRNALKLLDVVGKNVPVYAGCAEPLIHAAEDAAFVHGMDGFGDIGYLPPRGRAQPQHAASAIVEWVNRHPHELTLVMLGPLTNLAMALRLDPDLPNKTERLVVMGGAVTGSGNTGLIPAEFNIGFDPEAAHVVFSQWPQFDLVDWEAVLRHGIAFRRFEDALSQDTDGAKFYRAISRKTLDFMRRSRHPDEWHAADALAMAVAIDRQGIEREHHRAVAVELQGKLTRGATVVDWQGRGQQARNASIVHQYKQLRFEELVNQAFSI